MPYAFALYVYRHHQEIRRRKEWLARMQRLEGAHLTALAFHEPNKIAAEHRAALADAGAVGSDVSTDDMLEIGRRLAAEIDRGRVVE